MKSICYLLDENVDPQLRAAMHRQHSEMVIWIIGDPGAPVRGTLDPQVLMWCEANDFSLVTNNRTSMPRHLHDHLDAGRHVPGIFTLSPDMPFGETVDELILIWEVSDPADYLDQIIYLPVT
jgi:hypothetical protein